MPGARRQRNFDKLTGMWSRRVTLRTVVLTVLLIFPAQLLAVALLPCLHADVALPPATAPACHVVAADRQPPAATNDAALFDCGKCQMELLFLALAPVAAAAAPSHPDGIGRTGGPDDHFYQRIPDLPDRPPRMLI